MKRTAWFDREFLPIKDNGLFPCILERLEGTAARLTNKINKLQGAWALPENGKWSINKEVGHLIDLEPLWYERALQIIDNQEQLKTADLTNKKTHEADHDEKDIRDLIGRFEEEREKLLTVLRQITEADLDKSALHPRLGTPMKLIDLAFFVAEHDDHHLAQISYLSGTVPPSDKE